MPTPLAVTTIRKQFGKAVAVHDLSFEVAEGEVLGIIGPNGAGKTTTIKMILGLLEPDEGMIRLFGKSIADADVRRKIGYMPETPTFYNNLTGRELMTYVGQLFGLSAVHTKTRSLELLQRLGLTDAANRQLKTYSKGMLQRLCLAQALINRPQLLFLDEPLDGLDPVGRIEMKEILLEIKKDGTAIVFNSHILSDVEQISDRIAIINKGHLLQLDTVKKLVPKGRSLEEVFIEAIHANV